MLKHWHQCHLVVLVQTERVPRQGADPCVLLVLCVEIRGCLSRYLSKAEEDSSLGSFSSLPGSHAEQDAESRKDVR